MSKVINPANFGRRMEQNGSIHTKTVKEIVKEKSLPGTSSAGYLYHTAPSGNKSGEVVWSSENVLAKVSGTHQENHIPITTVTNGVTSIKSTGVTIDEKNNISTTGTVSGTLVSGSDKNIKTIVGELGPVLDKLTAINYIKYYLNEDKDKKTRIGMVAQELQKVFPELVWVTNKKGHLGVEYGAVSVIGLSAITELQERVVLQLKTLLDDLTELEDSTNKELTSLRTQLRDSQEKTSELEKKFKKMDRRIRQLETSFGPYADVEEDMKELHTKADAGLQRMDTFERRTQRELKKLMAKTGASPHKAIEVRVGSPRKHQPATVSPIRESSYVSPQPEDEVASINDEVIVSEAVRKSPKKAIKVFKKKAKE